MEDLVEKLRILRYQRDFCGPLNFAPLPRNYFASPQANPNAQLYYFTSLFSWLAKLAGNNFTPPGQFDDPNATAASIASLLKEISPDFDYGSTKLRQGFGDGVIAALSVMTDKALKTTGFRVAQPLHTSDDVVEEAEIDDHAEVMLNAIEEDLPLEDEQEPFNDYASSATKNNTKPNNIQSNDMTIKETSDVDLAEWKLEVECVAPSLKVIVANDHKDWRIHLQQMLENEENINTNLVDTKTQLGKIHSEINKALEKISSREKYINSHFESLVDEYRTSQETLSQLKLKYNSSSEVINTLTDELSRVSDELDSVKTQIDDLGSGMTDSKPLVNIRQALQCLKSEIKQMDIRLGVVEHSLLVARLKNKGNMVMGMNDIPVLSGLHAYMQTNL